MSDPLSVVGSVVGIISLGLTLAQGLIDYYDAFKDKNSDVAFTTKKLRHLQELLQTLSQRLGQRQFRPEEQDLCRNIALHVQDAREVIGELEGELQKFRSTPQPGAPFELRAAGRRLIYPLRQSTLQKMDEDVDAIVSSLSLALQLLQYNDVRRIQDNTEDLRDLLNLTRTSQVSQHLSTWLRAPDASINFNEAIKRKHPGTGLWFVESSVFSRWLRQPNSFLWVVGFAGCGKSVLVSTALQFANRHRRGNPRVGVAYFYFTFNDESKQDASAMLRALVLQLSSQLNDKHRLLSRLHDSYQHSSPPDQALLGCLHQLVQAFQEVYIVVDALDESPRDTHREATLLVLADLRAWSEDGLHIMVSSRDEVDIREELMALPWETVEMRNEHVDRDIASFISQHLRDNRRLRKWSQYYGQIETALTTRAQGVFRWVECQFKALASCPESQDLLEQVLASLPRTLDETYAQMLCNIPFNSTSYARQMLTLLCCARRPLTVDELIVSITFEGEDEPGFNPKRKLKNIDAIHQVCPGFISVDANPTTLVETVRLAHFSVREYLESDRILHHQNAASFGVRPEDADRLMAALCLTVLLGQPVPPQDEAHLVHYAAQYWPEHYRNGRMNPQIEDQAFKLFASTDGAFKNWFHSLNAATGQPLWANASVPSPLYHASSLGLNVVIPKLLEEQDVVDCIDEEGGRHGAALHIAAFQGHEKTAQLLLGHGADVDAKERYGKTALHMASSEGHLKIAQILLDGGAYVNAKDKKGATALFEAAIEGHPSIVRLLLDNGAVVNTQDEWGRTALNEVASQRWRQGHEDAIRLLIEGGADLKLPATTKAYTPVHDAATRRHDKALRLLLEGAVDVDQQDKSGNTALDLAIDAGGRSTVRLLLDNGADVNREDGEGRTPLHRAMIHGFADLVRLLLERGAGIDKQEKGFQATALHMAVASRYDWIVELLVEKGAAVNLRDSRGRTPLEMAWEDGQQGMYQLLLKGSFK
ncbi:hypothetical protein ACJ41O_013625 [Fusarium nematophilum]